MSLRCSQCESYLDEVTVESDPPKTRYWCNVCAVYDKEFTPAATTKPESDVLVNLTIEFHGDCLKTFKINTTSTTDNGSIKTTNIDVAGNAMNHMDLGEAFSQFGALLHVHVMHAGQHADEKTHLICTTTSNAVRVSIRGRKVLTFAHDSKFYVFNNVVSFCTTHVGESRITPDDFQVLFVAVNRLRRLASRCPHTMSVDISKSEVTAEAREPDVSV